MKQRTSKTAQPPPPGELMDQRAVWSERLARVRRSQARTNVTGMTRPPRDPDERRFLEERGLLGPFEEADRLP